MSKTFKFQDHSLKLNIQGIDYKITFGGVEDTKKFKKLEELSKEFNNVKDGELDKFLNLSKKAVDGIIKDGAFDEIFRDREPNWIDVIQLLQFLSEEVIAHRNTYINNKYNIKK